MGWIRGDFGKHQGGLVERLPGKIGDIFSKIFAPCPIIVPPPVLDWVMSNKPNPETPPPKPVTEIAFLLDRSGSMAPHTEAAIAGFNEFLANQQQVAGLARLTLVLFDDRVEIPIDNIPVSELVDLDTRTYTTRGSTALLDAIGQNIDAFKVRTRDLPENDRPDQVIFAIFTDSQENASHQFNWLDIAGKIRRRQEKQEGLFHFRRAFWRGRSGIPAVLRAVAGSLATGPVPPGTPVLRGIERFRHRVPARGNPVASAVLTARPGACFLGQIASKAISFITYWNSMPWASSEPVTACGSEREPSKAGSFSSWTRIRMPSPLPHRRTSTPTTPRRRPTAPRACGDRQRPSAVGFRRCGSPCRRIPAGLQVRI
jgi:hypothetical protein